MTVASADEVELVAVTKVFRHAGASRVALNDVSLLLTPGARVGIVGESGSGKSTLARTLCGLSTPTRGAVRFGGREIGGLLRRGRTRREFRRAVQFVAQDVGGSFDPGRTCRQVVTDTAVRLHGASARSEIDTRLRRLMDAFHLDGDMLDRSPTALSGGQRQRLSLIRGLLVAPDYLVCDEVVSALDVSVQADVLNTLRSIAEDEGTGIVFIAHNLPATAFLCDRIAVMYRGDLIEVGATPELIERPRHPYTRELIENYRERERQW